MVEEGPLRIGILEASGNRGRELQTGFHDEFRLLPLDASGSGSDCQEMLLFRQLARQPKPHVGSDDLALREIIMIQVTQSTASASLNNLYNSGAS